MRRPVGCCLTVFLGLLLTPPAYAEKFEIRVGDAKVTYWDEIEGYLPTNVGIDTLQLVLTRADPLTAEIGQ